MGKDILQPPEFVSNPRGEQANRRLNTSLSIAVVAALLSDCGGTGTVPTGPSPDNTQTPNTTEPTSIPSAEIAPTQAPETEIIMSQSYMTQEQILAIDPLISNLFGEFQNQIKTTKPDATFSAWGDLSRTSTGEQYFTPFFETSENGKLTQEYVVRAKSDGSALVTLRLQQEVVTASDGQEYYTLSQVTNADTLEAITPIPLIYIGVPKAQFDGLSSEQQGIVDVYFNAFGGILPQNSPDAGNFVGFPDGALKVRAALMPLAPILATPTETPTPTPEPKPAEIILTELGPGTVMETIVKRTSDCLFSPWQKYTDGSIPAEYKQLRDLLHEEGIVYDNVTMTGGNYPEPMCFIADKGTQKPFNKTFWYLTADGELDTFHIIVKSP